MNLQSILLVAPETEDRRQIQAILEFCEYPVVAVAPEALEETLTQGGDFRTAIVAASQGLARAVQTLRRHGPATPVVVLHRRGEGASLPSGVAGDVTATLDWPTTYPLLTELLQRLLREREAKKPRRSVELFRSLTGDSPAIRQTRRLIEQVADTEVTVLILGESGTGKEVVARNLHYHSSRRHKPFVPVNCGAIPAELLESELFGHEKGAFTGALSARQGRFEMAEGGTLFLDEIGDMPLNMQVKLLRVLQERCFERVGSNRSIQCDVRVIAATHRDLEAMVAAGEFRHDLYHRLQVVTLRLPPLRERREDIPLLVRHFTAQFAARYGRQVDGFDPASLERLCTRPWPGNVRELRNVVERHIALADGPVLRLEDPERAPEPELDADQPSLAELERRYILRTLRRCGGSRERTAAALGINKSTLWRKLRQYRQDADGQGPGKAEGDR